ncbi:hypothetical protein Plec18170_001235 [Paecilomyces lecythidis]
MSDSVDRVFVHALNTVKKIPRTGSARPPPADRLKLYGLYKQSMEGDVEGVMDRPEGDSPEVQAEREKWDAWYSQRGLTRTEAKRRYITTLIETMHRYASQTAEARELISELEFVWDQIKSNPSSSSSSSPLRTATVPMVPQMQQPNYGSISGRLGRSSRDDDDEDMRVGPGRDSRLRVLSPVSQPDEVYVRRNYDQEDDEDEDEEYQEARDGPYEDDDDENFSDDGLRQPREIGDIADNREIYYRKWRRRVEQALTKMTAEVAALREQMETRAIHHRRRSNLWRWLTWLIWVIVRQVLWDMAILAGILIWMRLKGDRRVEQKLRVGWAEVKKRLLRLRFLTRLRRTPSLP